MTRDNPKKQSPRLLFQSESQNATLRAEESERPWLSQSTYVSLQEGRREQRLGGLPLI